MKKKRPPPGLFVTGVDTGVGKTHVAALIAQTLRAAGHTVGVYKPAASGCRRQVDGQAGDAPLVSDDALALWNAAGRPGALAEVCPQLFAAPLAPHLAARAEGRRVDAALLRSGLECWNARSDVVLVEGAGGLMAPISDDDYVADLAYEFGYPLIVVAANRLGVINHTLLTLIAAETFREGLTVAGVVLNDATPDPPPSGSPTAERDVSRDTNGPELAARCVAPLLTRVGFGATQFVDEVDWMGLAGRKPPPAAGEW